MVMSEKKVNKLSTQMITFCEYLASGKSQRESYSLAYPVVNRKDQITDSNACKLLSIAKVFNYYQSLLKQNAESSQVTRDEILSKYKEIYNSSPDGQIIKNSDRLKALELTAKMLGFNEPDKLDLTSKGESVKQPPAIIVQTEEQKTALLNLIGNK
jgi:hypothetical protein